MIRRYFFVPNEGASDISEIEGVSLEFYAGEGQKIAILEIEDSKSDSEKAQILNLLNATHLLSRIYEMNQENEYNAAEGQLKKDIGAKKRFLSHLKLQPDPQLLEDYIQVHAKGMAWSEITQNMVTVGVLDMELYLNGYDAFLMMDTEPDFDIVEKGKLWATLPREMEWQAYVSRFQKSATDAAPTEKWKPLDKISKINYPK
jgi:L-rhamnose mutarotase